MQQIYIFPIVFYCLLIFSFTNAGPHTAVIHIQQLVIEESRIVKALRKYIFAEQREDRIVPDSIKTFFYYIEPISNSAEGNPHYAENPINAFHIINRFTNKWQKVFDEIMCDDCEETEPLKEFKDTVTTLKENSRIWPTESDIKGTARALFRLWKVYQLNLNDLFQGKILNEQTEPLSVEDVLLIARVNDEDSMYYHEIIWLEKYSRYLDYVSDDEKLKIKFFRTLAGVYNRYGLPSKALDTLRPYLESGNAAIRDDYEFYERHDKDLKDSSAKTELTYKDDKNTATYEALCRGNLKTSKQLSKLKCFSRKTKIPCYMSKEEVANYRPRVSIFHDVINDNEATFIKDLALGLLNTSTVVAMNEAERDKYRVSNTAWLDDTEYQRLQKIINRVGIITGLNTQYSPVLSDVEKLQVLNYGAGGMYRPHLDFLGYHLWGPPNYMESADILATGDRIATWMFYLSDVKAGGATVFPRIKTRIPVVKGSAAFWYNLKPSGDQDQKTLHAGCPVLLGSKWVGNKWIRQGGQVFARLCGPTKESTDGYPEI